MVTVDKRVHFGHEPSSQSPQMSRCNLNARIPLSGTSLDVEIIKEEFGSISWKKKKGVEEIRKKNRRFRDKKNERIQNIRVDRV